MGNREALQITSRTGELGKAGGPRSRIPLHCCIEQGPAGDEASGNTALVDTVEGLAENYDFIVIDTPGHAGSMTRLAHSMADTLVTPLNDSFVDFDLLGVVDPGEFRRLRH